MKKFLIAAIAVLGFATANAQDLYVGAGLGFNSTSHDGSTSTNFSINPEVGYRLSETFAIGINLGFSSDKKNKDAKAETAIEVKPYVRHTLTSWGDVDLFLDYGVRYKNYGISDAKTNEFGVGITPGIAYNATEKLSLVAKLGNGLGYTYSKPDGDGAKATNKFGIDVNSLAVEFGVFFNF